MSKSMARAERRANNLRVAANRRKIAVTLGHDHIADEPDGRLSVKHPLDCGKRCMMCHGEKLLDKGARRAREDREAMTLEDAAYDAGIRVRFQRHYA